ncbi:MAG: helix-turn-helix transcriptional regulator [Saprospiraceae bacterium]|nr:helix-turn-helix transcriptional regulator [Saprospiraceae bacterium]
MDIQISLYNILFILAAFLGIIMFVILTWINTNQRHSSRLLGAFILLFSLFTIQNLIQHTGVVVDLPFMYRIFKPLHYLAFVLLYLYVRSVFYGEQGFRPFDALHLIPTLVHILDFIPFYFMDKEAKLRLVLASLENPDNVYLNAQGWIPIQVHHILIPIAIIFYLVLSVRLLFLASGKKTTMVFRQNKLVMTWIFLLVVISNVLFLFWQLLFLFWDHNPDVNIFLFQTVLVGFELIIISTILMFYPNILYGFRGQMPIVLPDVVPSDNATITSKSEEHGFILSEDRRNAYLQTLSQEMERNNPFLDPNLTLADLATSTGISPIYLSAIINQEFGMNFRDYINRRRIACFKQLMTNPESRQYTLEAMARKSGFASRVTFSRAFQKFEGCTPTEYLRNQGVPNRKH